MFIHQKMSNLSPLNALTEVGFGKFSPFTPIKESPWEENPLCEGLEYKSEKKF